MRDFKDELELIRNPPGFNQFIHKINGFHEAAEELEALSKEKWSGLVAMDEMLDSTFKQAQKDNAAAHNRRLQRNFRRRKTLLKPGEEDEGAEDKEDESSKHSSAWTYFKKTHVPKDFQHVSSQTDLPAPRLATEPAKEESSLKDAQPEVSRDISPESTMRKSATSNLTGWLAQSVI